MSTKSSTLVVIVVLALFIGACGSGTATDSGDSTTTSSTNPTATTTTADTPDAPNTPDTTQQSGASESGGSVDGSDIDWATVDLTTIDWQNIDLRTIDYVVIRDNPTAGNLTDEMQAIVASRLNPGSVTLTIGDMTWTFDNFDCAVGLESTESAVYSLTTNTMGEIDGTRIQMQATIADDSGQGRIEGDDLVYDVQVDDISNFDNPAISWRMVADQSVVLVGYDLSAEGMFKNDAGPDDDAVKGTLVGTCSDQSRIP